LFSDDLSLLEAAKDFTVEQFIANPRAEKTAPKPSEIDSKCLPPSRPGDCN